jgi:hypothetical protein
VGHAAETARIAMARSGFDRARSRGRRAHDTAKARPSARLPERLEARSRSIERDAGGGTADLGRVTGGTRAGVCLEARSKNMLFFSVAAFRGGFGGRRESADAASQIFWLPELLARISVATGALRTRRARQAAQGRGPGPRSLASRGGAPRSRESARAPEPIAGVSAWSSARRARWRPFRM